MGGDLAPSLGETEKVFPRKKISNDLFRKNFHFCFVIIRTKHSFVTPFFSQFVLCNAAKNTTSRNIVGTNAWVVHPPQILEDRPPVPPKSPPMPRLQDRYLCRKCRISNEPVQKGLWHRRPSV